MHLLKSLLPGLLALASRSLAAPQTSLNNLPQCAQQAGLAAISATGCGLTDVQCICDSVPFLQTLRSYIESSCSASDQAAALQFGQNLCLTVGVTIPASVATPAATGASSMPASGVPSTTTQMSGTTTSTLMSSMGASGNSTMSVVIETSTTCATPMATFTGGASRAREAAMGVVGVLIGIIGVAGVL